MSGAINWNGKLQDSRLFIALNRARGEHPLFMVHPGGGLCVPYIPLAQKLEATLPCIGVQCPDLFGADDHRDLRELLGEYANAMMSITGADEFRLLGWSYGAAYAYEIANLLSHAGKKVSYLCLLDLPPVIRIGAGYRRDELRRFFAALPADLRVDVSGTETREAMFATFADKLAACGRFNATEKGELRTNLKFLLNELEWFRDYTATHTSLDMDLFIAEKDAAAHRQKAELGIPDTPYEALWQAATSGKVTWFPGGASHFELFERKNLQALALVIRNRLGPIPAESGTQQLRRAI